MIQETEQDRIAAAYRRMAKEVGYRPAAPGDGAGDLYLTEDQVNDEQLLHAESLRYADEFLRQADSGEFHIGTPDWSTNRALVYTLEAAKMMCAGDRESAKRLLGMAVTEVSAQ